MRAHTGWLIAVAVAVVAAAAGCSKDSEAATTHASPGATAAATAPSPAAAPAAGHLEGKNFRLDLVPLGECKAGGDVCVVSLRLEATGDYHVNKEYPYKFKAIEAANVDFQGTDAGGRNVFSKAAGDFSVDGEKVATMKIKFKATAKGPLTISGSYKMSVCSAQNCQLDSAEIGTTVTAR